MGGRRNGSTLSPSIAAREYTDRALRSVCATLRCARAWSLTSSLWPARSLHGREIIFFAVDFNGVAWNHTGCNPIRKLFHNTAMPIPAVEVIPICMLPLPKLPTSAAFSEYQAPRPSGCHYSCVPVPQSRERPPERPNRQRHQAERILAPAPGVSTYLLLIFEVFLKDDE